MTGATRVVAEALGAADVMQLKSFEPGPPGAGEAAIAVRYCGVAFSDVLMRAGRYPGGPRPPFTPGWDAVGTVIAVGAGVAEDLVGRPVAALGLLGGYSSHTNVPAARLVCIPPGLEQHVAACLPLNYATAWQMLIRSANAQSGQTVLVRGAAGGVGTAILDVAAWFGLAAYGVASSHKAGIVESFAGARYLQERQVKEVARLIGGFDIILDPVGGASTWQSLSLLAPRGRLVGFGFAGALGRGPATLAAAWHILNFKLRAPLLDGKRASFFRLSQSVRADPAAYRQDLETLLGLAATGRLKPLIADQMPLRSATEAHRRLENRSVAGKLLLDPLA